MKIFFLVGHLTTERGFLYYDLIEELSKKHVVEVYTGYPSRGLDKIDREKYVKNPIFKLNENATIFRVGRKRGEGKNIITRLFFYLLLTVNVYRKVKGKEKSIIFISSTPPFFGYLARKLSKHFIIYNAQDLFPDSLISMTNLREKNVLIKYFRRKEKQVYENVDLIITLSEEMKNTIITRNANLQNIEVINNWVDHEKIIPVIREDNILFDEYELDRSKFYVSYGGNIGFLQNWDFVFEVINALKDEDIYFVFFGAGSYLNTFKKKIKDNNLTKVSFFPIQPPNLVSHVYSFGDLELVPLVKNMTKYAFPSKISQILAAGSPILGFFDQFSEISRIINKNDLGFASCESDLIEIVSFLKKYRMEQVKFDKNNIINYSKTQYDRETQTKKYIDVIEDAFNNNVVRAMEG